MGKIQRSVMCKGGRRGALGLKGLIGRSRSHPAVKKTIAKDRPQHNHYHAVDKLEREIRELEALEAAGWVGMNKLRIKGSKKQLKNLRAKLDIKDVKQGER